MELTNWNPKSEDQIVWLDDPARYPYLRESIWDCGQTKSFPVKMVELQGHGWSSRVIGYITSKRGFRSGYSFYPRRYFWVKSYDRWEGHETEIYGQGGCPCEAVRTSSIIAGRKAIRGSDDDIDLQIETIQ